MAVTVIHFLASWLTDNQTRFLQFLDFQLQFNFFSFAASVTASFFLISLFSHLENNSFSASDSSGMRLLPVLRFPFLGHAGAGAGGEFTVNVAVEMLLSST